MKYRTYRKKRPLRKYSKKKSTSLVVSKFNRIKDEHFFRRSFAVIAPGSFSGNVAYVPYLNAYSFSLSQVPQVSEFTSLFDRYMITHVQLVWTLKVDPAAQAAGTAVYPKIYAVKDYDDGSPPASLDALREHSKVITKVLYPNRPFIMNVKPAVLDEIYRGAVTTTYSPKWKQWIDCAHTDVPHYGVKWGLDDFTNTNLKIDIEARMWFACKDTR